MLFRSVVVLVAREEGKASLVVGVTDDLTARVSAVDLVKAGAAALGGKGGGGRPDMAQAGGTQPDGTTHVAIGGTATAQGLRDGGKLIPEAQSPV